VALRLAQARRHRDDDARLYKEVTPVERLVNTESWGPEWPETINTLVLTEKGGKTTLACTVQYPSKEAREAALKTGMKEGWSGSYDKLAEYLRKTGLKQERPSALPGIPLPPARTARPLGPYRPTTRRQRT
jgi:uncharacterized protein YndB with AHSA1/START domain